VGFPEVQRGRNAFSGSCSRANKLQGKRQKKSQEISGAVGRRQEKCCASVCLGQNFLPLNCICEDDGTERNSYSRKHFF